jgi:hypothetical protein
MKWGLNCHIGNVIFYGDLVVEEKIDSDKSVQKNNPHKDN